MKLDYNVTIYLEVYHEGFADLLADISRLKAHAGIDLEDKKHPISVFEWEVSGVYHEILGPKYTTMDDVEVLKKQFQDARTRLAELEKMYAGQE